MVFRLQRSSEGVPDSWLLQGVSLVVPAISIGLSCLLLLVFLPRLAPRGGHTGAGNARRTWRSCLRRISILHGKRALLVALVLGAGIGLSYGLSAGIAQGGSDGLSYGLSYGLCYGLSYGLLSLSVSLILGTPSRGVHLAERLEWTWEGLLRSLSTPKHPRSPLALVSISFMLFGFSQGLGPGLNQGWDQGLSWALSWGLSQGLSWGLGCWLLLGLFQGISPRQVDNCDRRVLNWGIRNSFRNGVFMGIMSAVLVGSASVLALGLSYELSYGLHYGLSWGLSYELSYGLRAGLSQGLNYAWLFAMSGGLLAGMLCGGLAVLRHYILRLLLWRAGIFPWKVQPFLMDATTRILLLPLDGGYIFAHRQLLEYLADTSAEEKVTGQ